MECVFFYLNHFSLNSDCSNIPRSLASHSNVSESLGVIRFPYTTHDISEVEIIVMTHRYHNVTTLEMQRSYTYLQLRPARENKDFFLILF